MKYKNKYSYKDKGMQLTSSQLELNLISIQNRQIQWQQTIGLFKTIEASCVSYDTDSFLSSICYNRNILPYFTDD